MIAHLNSNIKTRKDNILTNGNKFCYSLGGKYSFMLITKISKTSLEAKTKNGKHKHCETQKMGDMYSTPSYFDLVALSVMCTKIEYYRKNQC